MHDVLHGPQGGVSAAGVCGHYGDSVPVCVCGVREQTVSQTFGSPGSVYRVERGRPAGKFLPVSGFEVQRRMCPTCVYRPDSPLDVNVLEAAVADQHGGFNGYRVCHSSQTACCAGFWQRHKDRFALGQIAQRLGVVVLVESRDRYDEGVNDRLEALMGREQTSRR